MKIYVTVDMEGIGGIVIPEQVRRSEPEYQRGRQLLTDEVNALVEGCVEGGATEVIVRDAHGGGFNFLPDRLSPKAQWIIGSGAKERFPELDDSFDGFIMQGYHAMAGTENAVRDHTMSSAAWQNFHVNGRKFGEIGIDAAIAGCHGVPTILVSGDDKACAEARRFLGKITTAVVKIGWGRHIAKCLAPEAARDLVRARAAEAVRKCKQCKPFRLKTPVRARLELMGTEMLARHRDGQSGFRQIDARTYEITGRNIIEVMKSL